MGKPYDIVQPDRTDIEAMAGIVALDFGTNWCGYCQSAEPAIDTALSGYPAAHHIKVEDGPGRRLGRSYKIKLWPTVVVLKDGMEVARVTRPADAAEVRAALEQAR